MDESTCAQAGCGYSTQLIYRGKFVANLEWLFAGNFDQTLLCRYAIIVSEEGRDERY
jgi:hypothetical protein